MIRTYRPDVGRAVRNPVREHNVPMRMSVDRDRLLADLDALLAIPSLGGTDAESHVQQHLAERWAADGLAVDAWDLPLEALRADRAFPGMEVDRPAGLGVTATCHGTGGGRSLLLNGHADVVPAGADWTGDPFAARHVTRDGREWVMARGAADMKGGLVAAWAAVRAVRDAGVSLRGDVVLASVIGEEDGGLGTFGLLRHGVRADMCVIPEPTDLHLVPANGGALTFRLLVRGAAAHASRRLLGVSAIERFVPVLAALQAEEARRNADVDPLMAGWDLAYPTSVGMLRAGDWASTVPDLLVAEGRLGVALGETVDEARASLEAAVAAACAADPWLRDHPVEVQWWGGQFAAGRTDPDEAVVRWLAEEHAAHTGSAPDVHGAPYGSDLRLLTGLGGIPTVLYGPGEPAQAHARDEAVAVDDIVTCAEVLARLIVRACG